MNKLGLGPFFEKTVGFPYIDGKVVHGKVLGLFYDGALEISITENGNTFSVPVRWDDGIERGHSCYIGNVNIKIK